MGQRLVTPQCRRGTSHVETREEEVCIARTSVRGVKPGQPLPPHCLRHSRRSQPWRLITLWLFSRVADVFVFQSAQGTMLARLPGCGLGTEKDDGRNWTFFEIFLLGRHPYSSPIPRHVPLFVRPLFLGLSRRHALLLCNRGRIKRVSIGLTRLHVPSSTA